MSGLGSVVRSGVGRRRLQTVVIVLASFMAVASAVLGGSLLVASTAPFDHDFVKQHGAHLTAMFDGQIATSAQIAATATVFGVAESSGPFGATVAGPQLGAAAPGSPVGGPVGLALPPLTIVGRDQPTSGVDQVSLLEGRWPTKATEIVLVEGPPIGSTLVFPDVAGRPSFTVIGKARSISKTADAWVTPAGLSTLTSTPAYQMLYRLTSAAVASDVDTAKAAITAAVPAHALQGSQSWLVTKEAADRNTALFVPFLIAFGLLGLVMAVLSIGGVVAGAVGGATYRIGVLKALGFTPAQVVRAYLAQALIPAGIGVVLGVVAGNLLAIPILASASDVYETTPSPVAPWVDVLVVAGALIVVCATGWVAALRAGRLRTVDALAVGRTPTANRGRRAAALAARLPLPRPASLGVAQPFARPGRMTAMVATVVFGAASVALGVGLTASLSLVEVARTHDSAAVAVDTLDRSGGGPVRMPGPRNPFATGGPDATQVTAAIAAQSGTTASYGIFEGPATVAGLTGSVDILGYTADPTWAGFRMTDGRWFTAPGEAVLPGPLLTATGSSIGDPLTLNVNGHTVSVRIVGELFSTRNDGLQVFTDLRTLTAVLPGLAPQEYRVGVASTVDVDTYVAGLETALQPFGLHANANPGGHSDVLLALNTLTGLLTVMLVAVAALGVLNAVVLQTRERVRELGVHKAIGMTPRQAVTVVLASVVPVGLVGGALGVPAGIALHGVMVPAMGASAGVRLPSSLLDVYRPWLITVLALGGVAIAVLGALMPAGWAARVRTATALRTE